MARLSALHTSRHADFADGARLYAAWARPEPPGWLRRRLPAWHVAIARAALRNWLSVLNIILAAIGLAVAVCVGH